MTLSLALFLSLKGLYARPLTGPAGQSRYYRNFPPEGRPGKYRFPSSISPGFFAGTAPFQGVTHFDNAFSTTAIANLMGGLVSNNASPQTAFNVGDPTLYPAVGLLATGWDFTATANTGNVSMSVTGMGSTGTVPTSSDLCIRMNRQTAGNTLVTAAVNTNDHSHVKLLSVQLKLNLIPNNPGTLVDITLTGYKSGSPVAGAVKTITGIHTATWTLFDVTALPGFTGVDEFRFTQAASTSTQISSMFIDEIALPTTPLPLTLTDFSGRLEGSNVQLDWTTALEQNTSYFEIQRGTDGTTYTPISKVPAAGNSSLPLHYSYTDPLPSVTDHYYFYRLRMADLDGRSTYSPVLNIEAAATNTGLSVYPNPFRQQVTVTVESSVPDKAVISVTDMSGRRLLEQVSALQKGTNILLLSAVSRLEKGLYLFTIATGRQKQTVALVKIE